MTILTQKVLLGSMFTFGHNATNVVTSYYCVMYRNVVRCMQGGSWVM